MNKKLLLVDDEPDVLKTTKYLLEKEGYEIYTANSGESCLNALEKIRPDLLVLDLKMPGKSGFQVVREIKAQPDFKELPIVIMSGMKEDATKYIAVKVGAVEFIEKPMDIERLKFHIKDLLSNKSKT